MRGFYTVLSLSLLFLGEANTSNAHDESERKNDQVYIVYMGELRLCRKEAHQEAIMCSLNKNHVVQIYNRSLLGFAARLSEEEATLIAQRHGVLSVFPDSMLLLHTTRSWDFLMSQTAFKNNIDSSSISSRSNISNWSSEGRDTIIGIMDTGIWPQHPSFNDKYMGPIPKRWKGICMTGKNSSSFKCNRKVIGARYYDDHDQSGSITKAMDENGHGTHVASTAAGIPVSGASYYGLAKGVAKGGSPGSRIAVYRICGDTGCASSSILKAFDDAIADGVDVISASLGGRYETFFTDTLAIGAFHAMEKGIIVVASVGNDGPNSETIENFSPWILSVGATTMDRNFQMGIVLGGRGEVIKGGGINFSGLNKSPVYRLVDGRSVGYNRQDLFNATHCIPGSLDGAKVKERIVLCDNNDSVSTSYKIDAMIEQGVIGVIMIDNYLRHLTFNFRINIAFAPVSRADGAQIKSYINSTKNPLATILPTEAILNYKPAPVVAIFSSRGPIPGIKNLLKPDVTAPGVGVLAACRFNDTSEAYPGKEPPLFNFRWGTSMSCPHVSGVAATVKYWHPTWCPSAIRSAIMTTAIPTNNDNAPITTLTGSRATPYDIGSGEISLFKPWWPGLVYETETTDYIQFLCNLGYNTSAIKLVSSTVLENFTCPSNSSLDLISDLNYPSIAISGLMANVTKTVKRTVTNVGPVCSAYTVDVDAPAGVHVEVVPSKLMFTKHVKELGFQVTFRRTTSSPENDLFGSITWSSFNHFYNVRSPFVVTNA